MLQILSCKSFSNYVKCSCCGRARLGFKPKFSDLSSIASGFSKKNACHHSCSTRFSTLSIMLFKYWFLGASAGLQKSVCTYHAPKTSTRYLKKGASKINRMYVLQKFYKSL